MTTSWSGLALFPIARFVSYRIRSRGRAQWLASRRFNIYLWCNSRYLSKWLFLRTDFTSQSFVFQNHFSHRELIILRCRCQYFRSGARKLLQTCLRTEHRSHKHIHGYLILHLLDRFKIRPRGFLHLLDLSNYVCSWPHLLDTFLIRGISITLLRLLKLVAWLLTLICRPSAFEILHRAYRPVFIHRPRLLLGGTQMLKSVLLFISALCYLYVNIAYYLVLFRLVLWFIFGLIWWLSPLFSWRFRPLGGFLRYCINARCLTRCCNFKRLI